MKKLFDKDEVTFAVVNIIAYAVLFSVGINVSEAIGIPEIVNLPIAIIMLAVYFIFIKKHGLSEYYGVCGVKCDVKKMLFFIPMILVATVNFWGGMNIALSAVIVLFVKASAGIVEEVLFRGFLFKAMSKDGMKSAIIVSSVTFGAGHIVNLLNGRDIPQTLVQIAYAVAIGFMLTAVFIRSGSIIPGMIMHAVINGTSAFAAENGGDLMFFIQGGAVAVISAAYAVYLFGLDAGKTDSTQ